MIQNEAISQVDDRGPTSIILKPNSAKPKKEVRFSNEDVYITGDFKPLISRKKSKSDIVKRQTILRTTVPDVKFSKNVLRKPSFISKNNSRIKEPFKECITNKTKTSTPNNSYIKKDNAQVPIKRNLYTNTKREFKDEDTKRSNDLPKAIPQFFTNNISNKMNARILKCVATRKISEAENVGHQSVPPTFAPKKFLTHRRINKTKPIVNFSSTPCADKLNITSRMTGGQQTIFKKKSMALDICNEDERIKSYLESLEQRQEKLRDETNAEEHQKLTKINPTFAENCYEKGRVSKTDIVRRVNEKENYFDHMLKKINSTVYQYIANVNAIVDENGYGDIDTNYAESQPFWKLLNYFPKSQTSEINICQMDRVVSPRKYIDGLKLSTKMRTSRGGVNGPYYSSSYIQKKLSLEDFPISEDNKQTLNRCEAITRERKDKKIFLESDNEDVDSSKFTNKMKEKQELRQLRLAAFFSSKGYAAQK